MFTNGFMKSETKPVIGISGPDKGGYGGWFFTALSVRLAGGKPLRITPSKPAEITDIDGLILGGGADVAPEKYGQERLDTEDLKKKNRNLIEWILTLLFFPVYFLGRYFSSTKSASVDENRDKLEFRLLDHALKNEKPVLGICRGMQLINIHFRGSLHQDIRNYYTETPQITSVLPKKKVIIKSGSALERITGGTECEVNALHNQAIKVPGEGIEIIAREKVTEIIQGIEHNKKSNIIGVQWHPEYLIQLKSQRNIFKFLVNEAKSSRK